MSRAEESLLNSKDDLLEKTEEIYARHGMARRCWRAALRVLIITPLVLSIVLFIVYFQDVAKPLDLLAGNTTKSLITENAKLKRDLGIFLHPEDHISREPNVLHFSWNITKATIAPDGVEKNVFLINGQFPGPTIEARSGDILEVDVWNLVEEGISIHWHGLHMRGANQMDGPVGITQCGIRPGEKITYRVPIGEQVGTFWYHAHSEVQRGDGLYGGLVVHNESADGGFYAYDRELLLLVGDWYHRPAEWLLARFQDRTSTGNEPNPDSLLVNGLGRFNCSRATHGNPVNCSSVEPPQLSLNKELRYKVRLVNIGSLAGVSITIPDSDMNVTHVDGGLPVTSRVANSIGVLYPGERVDFSLSWPESAFNTNTQITIEIDKEMFILSNPALTRIQSFLLEAEHHAQQSIDSGNQTDAELRQLDLGELEGLPLETLLPEPEAKFMIYATVQILNQLDDDIRALINRTYWETPRIPLISSRRDTWDSHQLVPWTGDKPSWVELTINNIDINGHPFHLHGFDFYVVASYEGHSGYNAYNPFDPWSSPRGGPFNLVNPIRKDTVLVPRSGYTVIRFLADNEGIWALHCHVLWHQASGMTMALQVLGDETKGFSEYTAGIDALEQCRT